MAIAAAASAVAVKGDAAGVKDAVMLYSAGRPYPDIPFGHHKSTSVADAFIVRVYTPSPLAPIVTGIAAVLAEVVVVVVVLLVVAVTVVVVVVVPAELASL